jgi:hypothetical protein
MAANVIPRQFNSYGSRRGNDAVMARGTFANIRLVNKLAGKTGPQTLHIPSGLIRGHCFFLFFFSFFVAKPVHMNSNDETWQMWNFVLCQELDVVMTSTRGHFFLSVIPFPVGFRYRQVAIQL